MGRALAALLVLASVTVQAGGAAPEPDDATAAGARVHLPPPEAGGAADALHARLERIVARRDVEALEALLARDVLVSFGGSGGPAEFRRHWALARDPAESRVWPLLERLLRWPPEVRQGEDGEQWATWPYWFARWPDDRDAWEHVFVAGPSVPVRRTPEPGVPVVARLEFEAAPLATPQAPPGWTAVRTADGATGYIAPEAPVHRIIGYRLLAHERPEGWRIDALVAGD